MKPTSADKIDRRTKYQNKRRDEGFHRFQMWVRKDKLEDAKRLIDALNEAE